MVIGWFWEAFVNLPAVARTSPVRWFLALLLPFAACGLQWLLWDYIRPYVWFLFFPVSFCSAWLAGLRGGLASTLISALLVWYFFIPPTLSLRFEASATLFSIIVFVVMGGLYAFFFERFRQAMLRRQEARTAEDLEQSALRLRRLAEVVEQVAAVRDLQGLMDVVRHAVRELTGADGATLVLRDNGCCYYADEDAIGPLWKGQRFPLETCISGWVMLHAQSAIIEDIYADPRIPHDAYRPTFVKSLSMVPVRREQPVAAIGCYWAARHAASPEELEMQQALADAMSVGLANLDLYTGMHEARLIAEQAASAVRASEDKYRMLAENAIDLIFWKEADGQYRYVSPASLPLTGYTPEEFMLDPQLMARIIHPDDQAGYLEHITHDAEPDQTDMDIRLVAKDGAVRWFSHHCRPIYGRQGEYLGRHGTNRDITERKQVEADLRRHLEELERFSRASVGRELEMIRLKQEVNRLAEQLGLAPPYELAFVEENESFQRVLEQ